MINDYLDDVKPKSEYPDTIDKEIDPKDLKKISSEEKRKAREEFNQKKNELRREWEQKNGMKWPTHKEDVYNEHGILIRKAGDKYEAHHIQPLELDEKNTADNITPIHAAKHEKGSSQSIHANGSPYEILVNSVKENN